MTPTSRTRTRTVATAAAWITAGAVGATVLTGLAVAAPQSSGTAGTQGSLAAASTQGSDQSPDRERLRNQLRSILHGEFTVQGADGPTTVDVQRGEVTAATATSVTVRSTDGFTATYAVSSTTVVRRDRENVTADKLAVGDTAFVRAEGTSATAVRALSPDALKKLTDRKGQGGSRGQGLRGLLGGAGTGTGG